MQGLEESSDSEAARPKDHFKIYRKEDVHMLSAAGGIAQIGLGDGFVGFNMELHYTYTFSPKIFFIAKGNYISGSGIAMR